MKVVLTWINDPSPSVLDHLQGSVSNKIIEESLKNDNRRLRDRKSSPLYDCSINGFEGIEIAGIESANKIKRDGISKRLSCWETGGGRSKRKERERSRPEEANSSRICSFDCTCTLLFFFQMPFALCFAGALLLLKSNQLIRPFSSISLSPFTPAS